MTRAMKKILWTTSDAIVSGGQLYRELAVSALSLLTTRRMRDEVRLSLEEFTRS